MLILLVPLVAAGPLLPGVPAASNLGATAQESARPAVLPPKKLAGDSAGDSAEVSAGGPGRAAAEQESAAVGQKDPASHAGAPARRLRPRTEEEWRAREKELLDEITDLRRRVREERESKLRQSQEWIEYVRLLNSFDVPSLPESPEFIAEALVTPVDPVAAEAQREAQALRARGDEIEVTLRALFQAEDVRTLDVLEAGSPHSFQSRPVTGPVVARVLDERGRLTGMFRADHMGLEVSRAAQSVTLVLDGGYESRGGEKSSFEGVPLEGLAEAEVASLLARGTRRIVLNEVDVDAWIERFPDLVDPAKQTLFINDGTFDLARVRAELGQLLGASTGPARRSWRLAAIGGVTRGELRDVQFIETAPPSGGSTGGGRSIVRRFFADRARIHVKATGAVRIELFEGSIITETPSGGPRTVPFLDGRYVILLPDASNAKWLGATIPRFGEAPPLQPATRAQESPDGGPKKGPKKGPEEGAPKEPEQEVPSGG